MQTTSGQTWRLAAPASQRAPLLRPCPAVRGAQAFKVAPRPVAARKSMIRNAASPNEEKPPIAQFSDKIGLPTDEGLFGFKPFPEVWVGRLAMLGFISSVVGEFLTGRGTLQQVGLLTPSPVLMWTIIALSGGATAVAAGATLYKAQNKELTANDLVRYRQFLGIQKEEQNIKEESERLKRAQEAGVDFTAPDNLATIAAAKAQGTPADRVLNVDNTGNSDGATTPESNGESSAASSSALKVEEPRATADDGMRYARQVEVTNGRFAMLGFLSALIVEAGTGKGIIGQGFAWAKLAGLLGPDSGF